MSNTERDPSDQTTFAAAIAAALSGISGESTWDDVDRAAATLLEACYAQGVARPDEGARVDIGTDLEVCLVLPGGDGTDVEFWLHDDGTVEQMDPI